MFGLIYIKSSDRKRLLELQRARPEVLDSEQLAELDQEIERIQSSSKPLAECTMEECMDFKEFVYDKLNKLGSIGASSGAYSVYSMLTQIENRISAIQYKTMMEEQLKKTTRPTKTLEERINHVTEQRSRSDTSAKSDRSKWTVDLGDAS